ncbi:MAG: YhcN/YlaJ family sporulation lipoprotein [Clostridia bacterium]|nr:YhcN/YlaJ family sporulation lipoprotein [Clostridia bacterium]
MRRRFPVVFLLILGIGLLSILFLNNNNINRNAQRLGQNGTTQNGRNLAGENIQGVNPGTDPNGGNMLGGNRDSGSGINPPDAGNINATPNPGNNNGTNRDGQQIQNQMGFEGQKAGNIRDRIGNIDGASRINAVVNGNTALVGYTPTNNAKDANSIRNDITNRIKQIDNSITNVLVSDRNDISSGIERLANNIRNNGAAQELNNDFNKLVQSIRP